MIRCTHVHNQLKPVKLRTDIIYQLQRLDEQSTTCADNVGQYLDDLDDSSVVVNPNGVMQDEQLCVDNRVSGGSGIRNEQQIDERWVNVDVNNIVPNRTRGIRHNYADIASGNS